MKRKVLLVITKGGWGGAQRYVFDLATHLPKSEFEVGVVYGQPGTLEEKLRQSGTMIYHSASLGRDVSLGKDVRSFFELYRLFKKERPAIVHLNSSKAGGVGALAARLARVERVIFTAHGWPFLEQRGPLARAVIWLFSWATALLSHRVIVVSNYDLAIARRMPFVGHKTVRIYNGLGPHPPLGSGEVIRRAFPPGVTIVGTIGELNKNKNQRELIERARLNPNLYVAIVGEGEERAALEHLIHAYNLQSRVKLFGFIPANEVLRGFDLFALPSLKEGLPYVLLEAKAAGLPIEANPVGGVGEILQNSDPQEFVLARMVEKTLALYRSTS